MAPTTDGMTLVSNTIPLGNHTVYSTYLVHLPYIRHLSAEYYDVTLTIASAIPSVYRLSVKFMHPNYV